MTARRTDLSRLLRWYPEQWRERYGDEFGALIEDHLDGGAPTLRFRLSIARAGLRERAIGAAIVGWSSSPAERARTGVLLVLGAWAAFVIAGSIYAKLAEHFVGAVPAAQRTIPTNAFDVLQVASSVAAGLFLVGIVIAVPAFARFLRAGGWPEIKRIVIVAAAVGAVLLATGAGLVVWAHSLQVAQRNGADDGYSAAFVAWALLLTADAFLWARAAITAAHRLSFSRPALALESGLAVAVAAAMCAMTVAGAIWWGSIAEHAPWFLHGTRTGTAGSPFDPQLAGTMAVMLGAAVIGQYGVARIGRSWVELRRGAD
jgi:hypothetical protein